MRLAPHGISGKRRCSPRASFGRRSWPSARHAGTSDEGRPTSPDEGGRTPESLAGKGRDELWSPAGPRPPPIPSPLSSGNPGPTNPGRTCPPEGDAGRAEPELVPTRGTG